MAIGSFVTFTPEGYVLVSSRQGTFSPPAVFVAPIRFTKFAGLSSGCPRQLLLMNENRRCSILFHLLVPGGK